MEKQKRKKLSNVISFDEHKAPELGSPKWVQSVVIDNANIIGEYLNNATVKEKLSFCLNMAKVGMALSAMGAASLLAKIPTIEAAHYDSIETK